jgi:hypothetical protein
MSAERVAGGGSNLLSLMTSDLPMALTLLAREGWQRVTGR